ncbi:hypothetical protein FDZ71_04130 [bacterium]|nr:MAG: hypothetical protein FDZ71_04130 [bacterium]
MQKVLVFQRNGLGAGKIKGIERFGSGIALFVVDVATPSAPIVDDPERYFPENLRELIEKSDLVVDHLYHPDLSGHLLEVAKTCGKEVVATGRKIPGAVSPCTCCSLGRIARLGPYAEQFGTPEFSVVLGEDGRIKKVEVLRGAPCGATWEAAKAVEGLPCGEAETKIGLLTQFNCFAKANPNVFLQNPLHIAGEIHSAALAHAIEKALEAK